MSEHLIEIIVTIVFIIGAASIFCWCVKPFFVMKQFKDDCKERREEKQARSARHEEICALIPVGTSLTYCGVNLVVGTITQEDIDCGYCLGCSYATKDGDIESIIFDYQEAKWLATQLTKPLASS